MATHATPSSTSRLIATMEGALLLARMRQSPRPILDVATAY
jgi:hypothetical protein